VIAHLELDEIEDLPLPSGDLGAHDCIVRAFEADVKHLRDLSASKK